MPTVLNGNASIVPWYCTFQFVVAKCTFVSGSFDATKPLVRCNGSAQKLLSRNSYVTSQTTCNDIKCQDNVDVVDNDNVTSFDGIALFVAHFDCCKSSCEPAIKLLYVARKLFVQIDLPRWGRLWILKSSKFIAACGTRILIQRDEQ